MRGHERLNVGLVHHPIIDKAGKIVATNVTNLDVHDIARVSRVYGVSNYFVINPMKEQSQARWRHKRALEMDGEIPPFLRNARILRRPHSAQSRQRPTLPNRLFR